MKRLSTATRVGIVLSASVVPIAGFCSTNVAGAAGKPKLSGTVTVVAPSGTTAAAVAQVGQAFTESTGVKVSVVDQVGAGAYSQISAQASDPSIGVVWGVPGPEFQMQTAHLLSPIPAKSVPNEKLVSPNVLNNQKLNPYAIPVDTDATGIEYNASVFSQHRFKTPTSFSDLWNKAYCGHVAVYGPDVPAMEALLNLEADTHKGSASNLNPAYVLMKKLSSCLEPNGIMESAASQDLGFEQGNTWIAINSGSRTSLLQQTGVKVAFAPTNDVLIQPQEVSLVKGAPNKAADLAFMNYALSGRGQDEIVTDLAEGPVETGITVPTEVKKFEPDVVGKQAKFFIADWPIIVPEETQIIQDFDSKVG